MDAVRVGGRRGGRLVEKEAFTLSAAAAVLTSVVAFPVRRGLLRAQVVDVPNHRSSHRTPVPRGGGIAPAMGVTAAAALARSRPSRSACLAIGGLGALGLVDDATGHVPALARLAGQLAAGAMLGGAGWDRLLGAIATAGIVNVTNFMDGINAISSLTGLVWGVNAQMLARPGSDLIIIGALVAGGSAGFLPHNSPRARLFLGDVGSYAMGGAFAAGVLSRPTLQERQQGAAPLLLYGVDAAQALIRRHRTGQPLGTAHRDHIYQQLVDGGLDHLSVALFHAICAAGIAGAHRLRPRYATPSVISIAATYLAAPHLQHTFSERHQAKAEKSVRNS